jgi:hypothetical protein
MRPRGLKPVLDEELPPDQLEFSDLISSPSATVLFCVCFDDQGSLVRQL